MESLPGWAISLMPGPHPRQHKHERRYTPGTHSVIPTRRIWNHNYGWQMIFGDLWHSSYRWGKKPEKTSPRKPVPTRDQTWVLGVARACYRLFHSGGQFQRYKFLKLTLIYKFQNVPCALGFEVKHSKFFFMSFRACIIILSMDFTINKLFWP